MPFPLSVRIDALVACQRHCCLCHQRKHTRLQCHHIVPEADDGPDTYPNCIPLCPDCHAEVMAFNPRHSVGATPYHAEELIRRRDDWYAAIAQTAAETSHTLHRSPHSYPHSTALSGRVSFDYSNHDGFYRLGTGNSEFLTHWTKSGDTSIYCYSDRTNISLALAAQGAEVGQITDASLLNFTSRVRTPTLGQVVVFENHAGRFAAATIAAIGDSTRGAPNDLLAFDYRILDDGTDDFTSARPSA